MDIWEWIEYGIEHRFCKNPVCQTHDLVWMTPEESDEFEKGGDPCVPVLRLLDQELALPTDNDDGGTVASPVA